MQFGVHIFPTETSFQPDELARAVEERGLESLWFSEHTHIPVRFLEAPGRGPTMPSYYWETYDIFIAMTLAAAANGRDPDSLEISLFEKSIPDEKTLAEMETAGVKRIILTISAQNREEALPKLDLLEKTNR